ncbi:flagellar basal-body rod protein FlgG [Chitinispirillales bacterium ANBcel5]|uniref:flagellar basal-body rod protein FlgG n=1 Tax=Cellulosispirillum alkaliphilum TaxID=3039283 RepID=UPI002A57976C|nr:flagellar basal-body rod protein FlgG [Chitinispirillales bacterium ANBcel5]
MMRSMKTAATGMEAQQLYMDTISNNLSNVNTTGFKRSKVEFQDLMYQTMREPGVRNFEGAMAPSGIEVGLGVKPAGTQRIFEQGSLNRTENPLDIAVKGEGMFQIMLPDGSTAYTRDGSFKLSSDGTLVTSSGFMLQPQIAIPEGSQELTVAADGRVTVMMPGDETSIDIGQIELVRFVNPSGLKSLGGNLYSMTDASGLPMVSYPGEEGAGVIEQGYTEASNVQIVEEMVGMITAQRAFEIVSKSIQTAEEMLQIANNLKR